MDIFQATLHDEDAKRKQLAHPDGHTYHPRGPGVGSLCVGIGGGNSCTFYNSCISSPGH